MPNKTLGLRKKIEAVMRSEDQFPAPSFASLLHTISIFYGRVHKLRQAFYRQKILPSRKLPCTVISVGNITLGGTGKTPMTIHVARQIKQLGYAVAIISRGYKGGAERHGGIVSDGKTLYMDSETAGDEPYMIACRLNDVPVIVGKNRFAAGMLALRTFQPDVIVLDDAFQHLQLKRDIDLILLDDMRPFGNAHLLPRGILREPISSLARGTACILTRSSEVTDRAKTSSMAMLKALLPARLVFRSFHVPYCYRVQRGNQTPFNAVSDFLAAQDLGGIKHHKVFGFSGIARNDDFQRTVKALGLHATGFLEFSDHHPYSTEDLETILRCARDTGADRLITTEKDHVRLAGRKTLPMELIVVGVKVSFGNQAQAFMSFIEDRLHELQMNPPCDS